MMLEKNRMFLGKAPEFGPGEIVMERFLYIFDFTFGSEIFADVRYDLKGWLLRESGRLPYMNKINKNKEWWVYILITLKKICSENDATFGQFAIERILRKVDGLSEDRLVEALNLLDTSINHEFPDWLIIRLSELGTINSAHVTQNPIVKYFVSNFNAIESVFIRNVDVNNLNYEHLAKIWIPDQDVRERYTNDLRAYTEIYINFMISFIQLEMRSYPKITELELEKSLETMLEQFLINTLEPGTFDFEILIDALLKILIPLYRMEDVRSWIYGEPLKVVV